MQKLLFILIIWEILIIPEVAAKNETKIKDVIFDH